MHISPIYSTNFNKPQNKNISMKGIDPSSIIITKLISVGYRAVQAELKGYKLKSFLNRIDNSLYLAEGDDLVRRVQAITKLPDNLKVKRYSGDKETFVTELRHNATEYISKIPDNNANLIYTKRDFIDSLFNNGHEISKTFVKLFRQLDDKYYRSYKQEIMDKCFFSPQFNSQRRGVQEYRNGNSLFYNQRYAGHLKLPYRTLRFEASSEQKRKEIGHAFCNLKLLSSLDQDIYKSYFKARESIINRNKDCLKYYNANYEEPELYDEYVAPLLLL